MRLLMFCVLLLALGNVGHAQSYVSPKGMRLYEQSYYTSPQDCAVRDICDLKEIGFRVIRFVTSIPQEGGVEKEYGSTFYASYETETHDTLEKYVFVQFVRGCYFQINVVGGVSTMRFLPTELRGKLVPYCFPNWVIDRTEEDPVYSSTPDTTSRHHFAQWVDEDGVFHFPNPENMRYYRDKKPTIPKMGIYDQPDTAFVRRWENGRMLANNALLEFRTCLYLEKDVPRVFDEATEKLSEPIACYEWKSTFVYDHAQKRIIEGGAIERCFVGDILQKDEVIHSAPIGVHDTTSTRNGEYVLPNKKE